MVWFSGIIARFCLTVRYVFVRSLHLCYLWTNNRSLSVLAPGFWTLRRFCVSAHCFGFTFICVFCVCVAHGFSLHLLTAPRFCRTSSFAPSRSARLHASSLHSAAFCCTLVLLAHIRLFLRFLFVRGFRFIASSLLLSQDHPPHRSVPHSATHLDKPAHIIIKHSYRFSFCGLTFS